MKSFRALALVLALAGCSGTPSAPTSTSASKAPSASSSTTPAATTSASPSPAGTPITLSVKLDGEAAPVDQVLTATFDANGMGAHYTMGTKGSANGYVFLIALQATKALSSPDLALADVSVFTLNVGGLANGRTLSWQGIFSSGFKNIPTFTLTPNGGKLDLSGTVTTTAVLGGGKGEITFDAKGLPTK